MTRMLYTMNLAFLFFGTLAALYIHNWYAAMYAALAVWLFASGEHAVRHRKMAEKELADTREVLHAALRHDAPTEAGQ